MVFCRDCERQSIHRFAKWYIPVILYKEVKGVNKYPVCDECLQTKEKYHQNLKREIDFKESIKQVLKESQ